MRARIPRRCCNSLLLRCHERVVVVHMYINIFRGDIEDVLLFMLTREHT